MPREKRILSVIDGLYGAAMGETPWDAALHGVRQLHDGAVAIVFDLDRRTGAIPRWLSTGTETAKNDYINHINSINPRMHMSLQRGVGHVMTDHMFATERDMDRSEFYDWLGRVAGLRYFMGSRLRDDGDLSTFTAIEFDARHGHVDTGHVDLFRVVNRHLSTAWQMHAMRLQPTLGAIDEFVPWAVAAIDAHGRVIGMNSACEKLLAARDGIMLRDGRLRAQRAADDRTLQIAMARTLDASRNAFLESSIAVGIGRAAPASALSVQLRALYRSGPTPPAHPAAMAYITDPDTDRTPSEQTLTSLFGLSRQEARLAARLTGGEDLADAAVQMGISKNTARNHLHRIFEKTGATSQSSLMRLVLRHLPS
ncbi:MAG: hypothetical protein KF723_22835 [Rhizobiaceae bacterium]|nr:hypothetical protein [Rhizobiaceae bacterium]